MMTPINDVQALIDDKLRQSIAFSSFDQRLEGLGQRGGIIACVLIVLASIAISFSVLRQTAIHLGFNWWQAILWPSLVDGVILTMSLMLIRRSRLRLGSGWHWALLVTTELTSIFINAAHGADIGVMAIMAHALPPIMLFFLTKIISIDVRDNAILQGTVLALDDLAQHATNLAKNNTTQAAVLASKQNELAELERKTKAAQDQLKALQSQLKRGKQAANGAKSPLNDVPISHANEAKQAGIDARRQKILKLYQQDPNVTQKQLSQELNVSIDTIRRDQRALNGQLSPQEAA